MILTRTKYTALPKYEPGKDTFATISGNNVRFSKALAPLFGDCQRVYIEPKPAIGFRLIPTDDPSAHKITRYNKQTGISAVALLREIDLPQHTRIYCTPLADGSLLFKSEGNHG